MSQLFITGNSILHNRTAIETVNLEKLEKKVFSLKKYEEYLDLVIKVHTTEFAEL